MNNQKDKKSALQCNSPDCFLNFGPQIHNPIRSQIHCSIMTREIVNKDDFREESIEISVRIRKFIINNKERILDSFSHISEDEGFFILLIRDVFMFLKNKTVLLKNLSLSQLKEIPFKIYTKSKRTFSNSRIVNKEKKFLEKIRNLYGFIYLSTNQATKNKKVYVGQTMRTIEEEWGEIIGRGKTLRKKREQNPTQSIQARYILNAIAKYPDDSLGLKLIDIAYSQAKLDEKERYYIVDVYDSMNPKKGYNLTTGGRTGGRLSERTKKRVSETVTGVWNTPGYKEMMSEIQKEAWNGEKGGGRRKRMKAAQLESWDNMERRENASKTQKEAWKDEEIRNKRIKGLSRSSKKLWENPTEKMLESLKNMQQMTRKEISDIKEFLIDIKNTKNQYDFFKGHFFEKYGIKTHVTFNTRIKEILGGFGVRNHGEAHRFFYDRSIDEVVKYLDNPKGYSIFRDPLTKQFFKDVYESEKGVDLHVKYRVWHKNGLITKIKRIVGKFGINNYTDLKNFLHSNDVDESLKHFEQLDKGISKS